MQFLVIAIHQSSLDQLSVRYSDNQVAEVQKKCPCIHCRRPGSQHTLKVVKLNWPVRLFDRRSSVESTISSTVLLIQTIASVSLLLNMVLDDAWNRTTQVSGHAGVMPLHIAALVLCVINFLLNGFICISFHYNRNLFYKCHLYIFFAFALINSLSGFATIPTIINLFFHNNLNCPRWTIIIGSGFEIALDRMRKLLTIAIAVERLYAVYLPSEYHLMNHVKFARRCCIFATFWGLCDTAAMIAEDDLFKIRMHCVTTASSGPIFHTYFLISSIAFGILLLFLYIPFVVKLCLISEASTNLHSNIQAYAVKTNYRQANSLTAMVVLSVLLFSVVPCSLYFYDLIENKIVFMEAGPVVTIGYHMYGCSSFFIYNWQHRNIRRAMIKTVRRTLRCEWNQPLTFESAIVNSNKNAKTNTIIVTLRWSRPSELV